MPVTETRPVNERIIQEVVERLQLLTAGYSDYFVAPYVKREIFHSTETPKPYGIIVTQGSAERLPESDCPGNPPALAYMLPINIRCRIMPSETDTTPVGEYINVIAAEVQRVVCDESDLTYSWHTFEDLSFNAMWGSHEIVNGEGGFEGINVPLQVMYRVTEGNPFEVRA